MKERGLDGSPWRRIVVAAAVLALCALISNITTTAQLSGEADTVLFLRFCISKLVNAGTVWAALAVLAGWWVGSGVRAWVAGMLACETALVLHYGAGLAVGMFESTVFFDNLQWMIAGVVLGGPLGALGGLAHRRDALGWAAALIVPVGALAEPFVQRLFDRPAILPWTERYASVVCGVALMTAGIVLAVLITRSRLRELPSVGSPGGA